VGLALEATSGGSTIRGLVINRFGQGIRILSSGNTMAGNYIGTTADGTAAAGNSFAGIEVFSASNNTISGNVISANDIAIWSSSGTLIVGNRIGTNAAGTAIVGDSFNIEEDPGSTGTVIGGTTPAARNVIAGRGMTLLGTGTVVKGNYVGTDISGTVPLATNFAGIFNQGIGHIIGGVTPAERNVIIGGSGGAIAFDHGADHIVLGNFIGLAADGATPLMPSYGIAVRNTSNVIIGGTAPGAGNRMALGGFTGVVVKDSSTGISIRGNSMSGTGRGIDLNEDGQTPNDAGDADSGPNNLQNFPTLSSVVQSGAATYISGVLESTPSTLFTLDFYVSGNCGSGGSLAERWLGTTTVATDSTGHASFTFTTAERLRGLFTATATDPAGNTSELAPCQAQPIPTLSDWAVLLLAAALAAIALAELRR
jgi:parallel beta-helix repeat protein